MNTPTVASSVDRFIADSGILHATVHGPFGESVMTEGGEIPTLATAIGNVTDVKARLEAVENGQLSNILGYATRSSLEVDLNHPAGTLAKVTNDPSPANLGTYLKLGGTGTGSWIRSADDLTALEERTAVIESGDFSQKAGFNVERAENDWAFAILDEDGRSAGGVDIFGTWKPGKLVIPEGAKIDDLGGGSLVDALIPPDSLRPSPADNTSGIVFGILDSDGRAKVLVPEEGPVLARVSDAVFAEKVADRSISMDSLDESLQVKLTGKWSVETRGASPERIVLIEDAQSGLRRRLPGKDVYDAVVSDDTFVLFTTPDGRQYQPVNGGAVYPVWPKKRLTFYGDSLTAAAAGISGSGPLLGMETQNHATAGYASLDIAIRQGGIKPEVTVAGNTIPANLAVAVTAIEPSTGYSRYVDSSFAGSLAGVMGTLRKDLSTGAFTFIRDAPGAAVACPPGTRFVSATAVDGELDIQCLWMGRNDVGLPSWDQVKARVDACVSNLKPLHKRFIVVGVTNGTNAGRGTESYAAITAHNEVLRSEYGDRFYDIRRDFIDNGLATAGITPTAADSAAVADDRPPPSIMFDLIHPNAAGYAAMRTLFANRLIAQGYSL